jgi:hypothetical protein
MSRYRVVVAFEIEVTGTKAETAFEEIAKYIRDEIGSAGVEWLSARRLNE